MTIYIRFLIPAVLVIGSALPSRGELTRSQNASAGASLPMVVASRQEPLPPPQQIGQKRIGGAEGIHGEFVPRRLVILADFTLSMLQPSPAGRETRYSIAQWAVCDLIDAVPDCMPTAIITLRREPACIQSLECLSAESRSRLRRDIICTQPDGDCDLAAGLQLVLATLHGSTDKCASTCVVVISDGEDCHPSAATSAASTLAKDFDIHLTVLGTCSPPHGSLDLFNLETV